MPDNPVLDTAAALTAISIDYCTLDPRELMLARLAALVAVDAPPLSYLLNIGAASENGMTLEDVQGVLVAVEVRAAVINVPSLWDRGWLHRRGVERTASVTDQAAVSPPSWKMVWPVR